MTERDRQRRLAKIRRLATRRYVDPDERASAPAAPDEVVLEARSWRQAATNAGFAQRGARYGALGPRGRW